MPAREKYGAQPPLELLRQYLDLRGFYDRKGLFWKDVEDTTLVAGEGGRAGWLIGRFAGSVLLTALHAWEPAWVWAG